MQITALVFTLGEKDKLHMRNNIIEPVKNMSPQKPKK